MIISIIVLILIISFYDYFTARSWQQVTSNTRNDIVFENRNREYGAYVIRRDYDKSIIFIFSGLVLAIGLAYGALIYSQSGKKKVIIEDEFSGKQIAVKIAPVEVVIPPPVIPPPPPMERTVAFPPPIVEEDYVEPEIKTEKDLNEGKTGMEEQKGEKGDGGIPPADDPTPPPPPEDNTIHMNVDEPAEFPDYKPFMERNFHYPETAIQEELQGRCYLTFVVDKTGKISNVKVARGVAGCPECDAEAKRVIEKMPAWTPAKVNGKPVASYFNQSILFKLD